MIFIRKGDQMILIRKRLSLTTHQLGYWSLGGQVSWVFSVVKLEVRIFRWVCIIRYGLTSKRVGEE